MRSRERLVHLAVLLPLALAACAGNNSTGGQDGGEEAVEATGDLPAEGTGADVGETAGTGDGDGTATDDGSQGGDEAGVEALGQEQSGPDVVGPPEDPPLMVPVLLGRPTDDAVALNLVPEDDLEILVEHGDAGGAPGLKSEPIPCEAKTPCVVALSGLSPNQQVAYRLGWRKAGTGPWHFGPERTFHTARPAGAPFVFTVQADSHLDALSNLELYHVTLANVLLDSPDFHLDLGDTFMCEKYAKPFDGEVMEAPDAATVDARYLFERGHFGIISETVPLFLVNGNHEAELGWLVTGNADSLPFWATLARQRFYLNPVPDGFFSGDTADEPYVGQRGSWYAFEWGDALIVVLDPYWYTKTKSKKDGWVWTLGKQQYDWLAATLVGSKAPFRFVFVHNLVGGLQEQGRGGVEAAPYFEWGGKNLDGIDEFSAKRPGWGKPIHELLVDHQVTAVLHGHDHLYARQELDGIVYLEVPQPSNTGFDGGQKLADKQGYTSGKILSSSGHIRFSMSGKQAKVEYVRAYRPEDETGERQNRQIDDVWTVEHP